MAIALSFNFTETSERPLCNSRSCVSASRANESITSNRPAMQDKYLLMKQQLTDKVNRNETEMERLTHLSVEESAYKNKVVSAIELLDGEMQHEKITQELVDATIDTVYVYDKKRIEVVFKFDDILMRAIEKYQKGEKEA